MRQLMNEKEKTGEKKRKEEEKNKKKKTTWNRMTGSIIFKSIQDCMLYISGAQKQDKTR